MIILHQTRCLILDDNIDFIEILSTYLRLIEIRHINSCTQYEELLKLLEVSSFDIIFIGINLKYSKRAISAGMDLSQQYPNLPIIFLTTDDNDTIYHKIKKIPLSQLLSKNLSKVSLLQAVEIAISYFNTTKKNVEKNYFNSETPVFFRIDNTYQSIPLKDIAYFFTEKRTVFFHFEGRSHPLRVSLRYLEQLLYPYFLRIHKSFFVNTAHVASLNTKEEAISLKNKELLPIGRKYKHQLIKTLNGLL